MDVRLPDGTIIKNVPEGTTKEQIAAKFAGRNGFAASGAPQPTQQPPQPSFMEQLRGTAGQAAGNVADAFTSMFTDPLASVRNTAGVIGSMKDSGALTAAPMQTVNAINKGAIAIPDMVPNLINSVSTVGNYYGVGGGGQVPTLGGKLGEYGIGNQNYMPDAGSQAVFNTIGQGAMMAASALPVAGRNVGTVPGAIAEFTGMGSTAPVAPGIAAAQDMATVGRISDVAPPPGDTTPEIRAALEAGQPNVHTAGYQLRAEPPWREVARVERDPVARRAIRLGTDPDAVVMVERADPLTRRKMGQMVNVTHNWLTSGRSQQRRAADVAGEAIMDRVNVLTTANRIAGRMVNREVQRLSGAVDLAPVVNNFTNNLSNMGVRIGEDGLDFAGSTVSLTPAAQTSLNNVYQLITQARRIPARAAHFMKQAVTNSAKLGEQLEGVDAQTANVIRGIRADLNQAISTGRPGYRNANQHYSQTIDTLNDVNRRLGGTEDLTDADAARTAGTILRRTLSSAVSGGRVNTELGNLTDLSRQYLNGVEGFPTPLLRRATRISPADISDDLQSLMSMAAHLERRFGSPAPTSITGVMNSAAERASDVANVAGALTSPTQAITAGLNLARRKVRASDSQQLRALRDLIQRDR